MEAAALYVIGKARGMRAGCVLAVLGVTCDGPSDDAHEVHHDPGAVMKELIQETSTDADDGKQRAIQAAIVALRHLIRHDKGVPEFIKALPAPAKAEEPVNDHREMIVGLVAGVLAGVGLSMLLRRAF